MYSEYLKIYISFEGKMATGCVTLQRCLLVDIQPMTDTENLLWWWWPAGAHNTAGSWQQSWAHTWVSVWWWATRLRQQFQSHHQHHDHCFVCPPCPTASSRCSVDRYMWIGGGIQKCGTINLLFSIFSIYRRTEVTDTGYEKCFSLKGNSRIENTSSSQNHAIIKIGHMSISHHTHSSTYPLAIIHTNHHAHWPTCQLAIMPIVWTSRRKTDTLRNSWMLPW